MKESLKKRNNIGILHLYIKYIKFKYKLCFLPQTMPNRSSSIRNMGFSPIFGFTGDIEKIMRNVSHFYPLHARQPDIPCSLEGKCLTISFHNEPYWRYRGNDELRVALVMQPEDIKRAAKALGGVVKYYRRSQLL